MLGYLRLTLAPDYSPVRPLGLRVFLRLPVRRARIQTLFYDLALQVAAKVAKVVNICSQCMYIYIRAFGVLT